MENRPRLTGQQVAGLYEGMLAQLLGHEIGRLFKELGDQNLEVTHYIGNDDDDPKAVLLSNAGEVARCIVRDNINRVLFPFDGLEIGIGVRGDDGRSWKVTFSLTIQPDEPVTPQLAGDFDTDGNEVHAYALPLQLECRFDVRPARASDQLVKPTNKLIMPGGHR